MVDYGRWDHIEISDDEDEGHPNIDQASLNRWRHEARLQREAEERTKKKELKSAVSEARSTKDALVKRVEAVRVSGDAEEAEAVAAQLRELERQEREYAEKEAALERMEREHPRWNVDNISKPGFEKTIVVPSKPKAGEGAGAGASTGASAGGSPVFGSKENKKLLDRFGACKSPEDSKQFLLDHPQLLHEDSANYLVLRCLELQIEGNTKAMRQAAHQTIALQFIFQLAQSVNQPPHAAMQLFFSRMRNLQPEQKAAFESELAMFIARVEARAKEKIQEGEEEARRERIKMAPGGLDPQEVFDSLPPLMQEAFEKKDMELLAKAIASMDVDEAKRHIDRCEKSGLWVPQKGSVDDGADDGVDDGAEEAQE